MNMLLIGGAAVVAAGALAVTGLPALAQTAAPNAPMVHHGPMHHGGMMAGKTTTRAEVAARVADHFAKVDANRDGFVTRAEADAMHAQMRTKRFERRAERHDQRFDRIDQNNDGQISRGEWDQHGANRVTAPEAGRAAPAMRRVMVQRLGAMGGRMFEMADGNRDGRVSLAEAQSAALQHFDRMDTNRDGQLSPEERRVIRRQILSERRPG